MKKVKETSMELNNVCYGLAASFVMYSKFHFEIEEIRISEALHALIIPIGDNPTSNFDCGDFDVSNEIMREINLITLNEKLRYFSITCFSSLYGQIKSAGHDWKFHFTKADIQNVNNSFLKIYEEVFKEMDTANKMLGYKHFNKKHFNAWNRELYTLMKVGNPIWQLIEKVAEYLIERYKEVQSLSISGKEIEHNFEIEMKQILLV